MMDATTGLMPGQSWNVTPGPTFQARIGRDGRGRCIGRGLAEHPGYAAGYVDFGMWRNHSRVFGTTAGWHGYTRPWHTFERACRAAQMHSRMVIAAKRQEQGGE